MVFNLVSISLMAMDEAGGRAYWAERSIDWFDPRLDEWKKFNLIVPMDQICHAQIKCDNCGFINTVIYECKDSNPTPCAFPCRKCRRSIPPVGSTSDARIISIERQGGNTEDDSKESKKEKKNKKSKKEKKEKK